MYKESIEFKEIKGDKEKMNRFFLNFSYNSNKIENKETRFKDVEAIFAGQEVVGFTGDIKTIREVENHKVVCDSIINLCEKHKSKLSLELIKELHFRLMDGCFSNELIERGERVGEFKRGHYVVGIHQVGAYPEDVEGRLRELINEVNEVMINNKNALKVVSYFHVVLQQIHPFADGNGRVGRMLLNYLLIGNNLPPIIVFEEDKQDYYNALEHFIEAEKIDKMVEFLDTQLYKTWVKDYNTELWT